MNPDPHFAYLHDGASKLCASAERVKHLVEQMDFEAARQEFVKLQSAAWVMAVRLKVENTNLVDLSPEVKRNGSWGRI